MDSHFYPGDLIHSMRTVCLVLEVSRDVPFLQGTTDPWYRLVVLNESTTEVFYASADAWQVTSRLQTPKRPL
jgi:hypothetical protein